MSSEQEMFKESIRFRFIYSITGLLLGLVSILAGVVLFMNGVAGSTSWTAKVLGHESTITDAAPGALLFFVGLFVVVVTRYRAKLSHTEQSDGTQYIIQTDATLYSLEPERNERQESKQDVQKRRTWFSQFVEGVKQAIGKMATSLLRRNTETRCHEQIESLVDKAIGEAGEHNHSSFSFKSAREALRFREYFASYFNSIHDVLTKAHRLDGDRLSESLDRLFKKTALNGCLDAPYASYLIKDYIVELRRRLFIFGASIHRIEFCWDWLSASWREIDTGISKHDFVDLRVIQRVASTKIKRRIHT